MSHGQKTMYWLVDFVVPSFISKFGRDEFEGKILIASRQLWSLILQGSDDIVRSALIGPGYVKGVIKKATGGIEFEHTISAVIFDPTELRPNVMLPLVNMVSPDVIDPLEESSKEEIESHVRKVMMTRGKPLVQGKLAEVRSLASIPTIEYISTTDVHLEIKLTSGLSQARFVLKGINKKIYAPYSSILSSGKSQYDDPHKLSMFLADKRQLVTPSREDLSRWTIVEQSGERMGTEEVPEDGYDRIMNEYKRTLDFMKANLQSYVLT
ncbi:MAG: hypothetical protein WED04_00845 [Promethearchaeati archaeon SRVP18_Atabeyarchaeia-1]